MKKPEHILIAHLKKQGLQELVQRNGAFESTIVDAMNEFRSIPSNTEKMVFVHSYGTCEGDCGEDIVPFDLTENMGADDFVLRVLDMVKVAKKQGDSHIKLFNSYVDVSYAENIENYIFTLDQWFEINKRAL
jgi:hypothetical protein